MIHTNFKNYLIIVAIATVVLCSCTKKPKKILIFSKTKGFRHESIKEGKVAIMNLCKDNNISADTTEDENYFNEDSLKKYSAVIFFNTTGDVLNFAQQNAFERYIQAGGGFVGIHAATDTEHDWPWFVNLVGANFENHPEIQKATISVVDKSHEATKDLPEKWERTDEWYNFKNLSNHIKVLAKIEESTYKGGKHGNDHPMIWYHEYDGGRAFYTELGHTIDSYSEPLYLKHLIGGIHYAIGNNQLNYSLCKTEKIPDPDRFTKQILIANLNEPMALAISARHEVFFCERKGRIMQYDPKKGGVRVIGNLDVADYAGNGIMGLCLDPDFDYNKWIYLFYTDTNFVYTLSRFKYENDKLNVATRQDVISFKIDKEPGAHNGGTILFDKDGNLYISTGDNTPPWQANGFPPYDQNPGREIYDAQRSASNTNDYRGKILRIKPHYNKPGYTIPEGNLLPKSSNEGLPEIYAMGCRNPWRMSYDRLRNHIYWGEVGPDAGNDSTIGPRGYDEINQARKPGNFGWPYFIADNKPYSYMDLVENINNPGPFFDAKKVINPSKNNTGSKVLPSPEKAFIWYPYAKSNEFPEVGSGGRTACAGPFYYYSDYKHSKVKFPKFFDGKMLIFEWMRDWVMAVTVSKEGDFVKMEPVMQNLKFSHPTHMAFAPDGSLYIIEYGYIWYNQSENACLSRVIYSSGNRPPMAKISTTDTIGTPPFKAKYTAEGTFDLDNDKLTYIWFNTYDKTTSNAKSIEILYEKTGVFDLILNVKDEFGNVAEATKKIIVGNTPPRVEIVLESGNSTFFWPQSSQKYSIKVTDDEDDEIIIGNISAIFTYLKQGNDLYPLNTSHQENTNQSLSGTIDNKLIVSSDCKACHALEKKSVGPSFIEISRRYENEIPGCYDKLADKIIKGGGGVWGDHAMSAHPQISKSQALEMVKYIIGLGQSMNTISTKKLDSEGIVSFPATEGTYYITATYQDRGDKEGKARLKSTGIVKLIPNQLEAHMADSTKNATLITSKVGGIKNVYLGAIRHESSFCFTNIDLVGIDKINIRYNSKDAKGTIELRDGSPNGKLLSSASIVPQGEWEKWSVVSMPINNIKIKTNLYFVFKTSNLKNIYTDMINIDWLSFERMPMVVN